MHICTCAPNTQRIPLYTVNLAFTFNDLVRDYAPSLYPVVYGVAVNPEELGGLSDCHILPLELALLCALCAALVHASILDPCQAPRRPGETILDALAGCVSALGPVLLIALGGACVDAAVLLAGSGSQCTHDAPQGGYTPPHV